MRTALLAIVLLTGCSSTVDVTPGGRRCATSFGCDEGERCDDGMCTPDVGCPPALSPKLLFSAAPDSWIVVLGGHQYRVTQGGSSDAPTTTTVFTDLADGTTLAFEHAPGGASCAEPPAWCDVLSQGIETVFAGVTFDRATGKITAAASVALPEGHNALDYLDLPAAVLLKSEVAVTKLDVATQAQETIVELGDVDGVMGGSRRTPNGERKLVGMRKEAPAGWTLLEAPVAPNAAWTPFFTADAADTYTGVIPAPEGWFVLASSSGGTAVWRTGPSGSALLGTLQSTLAQTPDWDAIRDLGVRYGLGDRPLDNGSRGRAVGCAASTCTSEEIDLAAVERRTLGSVTIPQAQLLTPTDERWLACDTVEVLFVDPASSDPSSSSGADTRVYLARIGPSAP